MIHNEDIAVIFDELADLLEIENANPFRVRAYRNAARTVRGLARELSDMLADDYDITSLPGIGKDLAAKIREIVDTGHARALDRLHRQLPASLEDLLKIPGLGPKRVRTLFQELHIEDIGQLETAAREGRLRSLPGFGAKTEQHILDNIAARRSTQTRFLYSVAKRYAEPLLAYLRQVTGVRQAVIAGSYRRARETVGDLDILVTARSHSTVMSAFLAWEEVTEVVSQGRTRATVFLRNGLQVDLRVVAPRSHGAALYYFTGSKAHNIAVRKLAQKQGLKINEYGVFRGRKRIAGETEASVFRSVGLPFIAPELREMRGEIAAAQAGCLPKLIRRADLRGDLHVHSKASDGSAGIEEMALAARAAGLEYIAITDHTRNLGIAHGLDPARLLQQIDEIDRLNERLEGITLLKGSEVDILEDGSLDLPASVLARLDLVIGAVHTHFGLSRRKQTRRLQRAMESPYFTLLAHPSGRLLLEREGYEADMQRIIETAAARGCFLELNGQPRRLDLNDSYCKLAKEAGVLLSIDSDSHGPLQFENLSTGINQARRGWLEKKDVLNTRPLSRLRPLLRATMG